jgi:hypothetical protein
MLVGINLYKVQLKRNTLGEIPYGVFQKGNGGIRFVSNQDIADTNGIAFFLID